MSISKQVLQLKQDFDDVYESGEAAGIKVGTQTATNEFWDIFTANGTRKNYAHAFYGWGSEYIRPTRKIIPTDNASARSTFYKCLNLKKIEAAYFDFSQKNRGTSNNTGYSYTFYGSSQLEEIEDIGIQPDYNFEHAFECTKLRTIAKIRVDADTKFSNSFDYAYALENVTFEGEIGQNIIIRWSTKLSKASIENIIEHLSDTATGKTLTLSKTAVNNVFTTEEWNALIATKPNWTISLS